MRITQIVLRTLLFSKVYMILFLEPLISLSDRSGSASRRSHIHHHHYCGHLRIEPLHAYSQCQHHHIEKPKSKST